MTFFNLHNPLKIFPLSQRKANRKKSIWKIIKTTVLILFLLTIALFAWYTKDLPTPGKIRARQQAQSTKIFDRNGKLIFEIAGEEKRTVIPSSEIPDNIKLATLAAEDRNFYQHRGVDFQAILRALFIDIISGRAVQGGSTLTQQYVKNSLLSSKKTVDRKIKELILALEIEAMFSKEEILTLYLNEIPYGSNNYGIQAAAQAYFAKNARDLELHEAAMLAALPKAPTYYSPYGTHVDELKARRDFILDSMAELNMISDQAATAAKAQEIKVKPKRDSIQAPHFVFYVKEKLVEEFGEQRVEEGGLQVYTTLDLNLQKEAEKIVLKGVSRARALNASNGALIAVDTTTGEILTMVGSADYFDTDNDGNVNVTLSKRQPGSSFKPIVYAAGFRDKYNPAYTLWDVRTNFGNYIPRNYDGKFHGPVTIRSALANSLNIPAVKMLSLVGLNNALALAHDMGITTLNDPERYGLSLVLGGGEVKPIDMASAFAVFANGGIYHPPVAILKVQDAHGNTIFEHRQGKGEKKVLDENIAYQITDILSDRNARVPTFGFNSPLNIPGRQVAVKTGTTQEYRDAWTVGYSTDIAVAVWVGNNDNTPMNRAPGVRVAGPIFHDFMIAAHRNKPAKKFARPKTIRNIEVDKLSNKLPTDSSPERIVDIFAPWQVPTQKDDVHVTVRVNKKNNKKATDLTPASLIEEKTFTIIHSERPEDPRWENPVLQWTRNNGIEMNAPPEQDDDMYNEKKLPQVTIISPEDQNIIQGTFTIKIEAKATYGLKGVELMINNKFYESDVKSPYEFTIAAGELKSGDHIITAKGVDEYGATGEHTITITVVPDTSPPGSVSNVSATPNNQAVTLSWSNPDDSDLARVKIYVSEDPQVLGTLYPTEVIVQPGTQTTFTVESLVGGTIYYFTLRPVDSAGNIRQDPPYHIFATPLDS